MEAFNYLCKNMALPHKESYFHRWVVFLIDRFVCTFSVVVSTLLFHYHQSPNFIYDQLIIHGQIILLLSLVMHLIMRPHMGIVRQTALYDLVKILGVRFLVLMLGFLLLFELHKQGCHG
jgi:hypothetical protein